MSNNPFRDILNQYSYSSAATGGFNFEEMLRSIKDGNPPRYGDGGGGREVDWKKAYQTLQDDFSAFRKRNDISKEAERKNLRKELIGGFLDIVDFILYTYKAKDRLGTYTDEDKMVLNKVFSFLGQYGVEPMKGVEGQRFDHNRHDAILVDGSGMFEEDTVTLVLSPGYMIDGEVLRHARVCVAKRSGETSPTS